jgi:hypothetical protein
MDNQNQQIVTQLTVLKDKLLGIQKITSELEPIVNQIEEIVSANENYQLTEEELNILKEIETVSKYICEKIEYYN